MAVLIQEKKIKEKYELEIRNSNMQITEKEPE
jgi:hypothetical protein